MRDFKEILVLNGQSVIDIALQEYGTIEGMFILVSDNKDRLELFNANPPIGTKLIVRNSIPSINLENIEMADYYESKKLKVVSNVQNVDIYGSGYVDGGYVDSGYMESSLGIPAITPEMISEILTSNKVMEVVYGNN